jgi:hypothetical protein
LATVRKLLIPAASPLEIATRLSGETSPALRSRARVMSGKVPVMN